MKRIKIQDTLISYDPKADALYIQMREGKVAKTIEYADDVYVDLNSQNALIGIEFLCPSEASPALIKKIALKYHVPDLKSIDPSAVPDVYAFA